MSGVVERLRSRLLPSASVLALIIGVAGCSGDTTRFNDNPYARGNPDATGSIQQPQGAAAGHVESRPLPPPTAQQAPAAGRPATVATGAGTVGGGKGLASYTPAPAGAPRTAAPAAPEVTGSVATKPAPAGNWSWDGGTAVTVAQGDTVEAISRKYGVPTSAILQANNLVAPATLYAGQQLVIPRYNNHSPAASAAPPVTRVAAPAQVKPAPPAATGNPGVHVVAPGETLSKISRLYGKSVADIAKANNIQPTAALKVGERLVIPGVRVTAKPGTNVAQPAQPKEQTGEPTHSVSLVAPTSETPNAKDSVKTAEGTGSLPTFRWPAQGRIIAGFGSSPNGGQNDGINLAVPEGTPVKAAEDGVVAYAGNELKGYGNLVLVRHPNGYVTAYAHAKELLVKRGDQIKRGQVIARSGQTGNVNAPQLHFEIRKGATPLDPMRFLKGA
jgi:murein DD-endopeptidase MepM/ murein hydrolase activator NlpD